MLKIIPCAPWNFPVFRFLTGKGRGVFHGFNGVFNISTVDNRYTRWITCSEYTECERGVNRKVACLCKRVEPLRPRRLGQLPCKGSLFARASPARKPPHEVGRWSSAAMTGGALPACPAPNQKSVPLSFPQESGTQSKLNFLFGAPQTSPC